LPKPDSFLDAVLSGAWACTACAGLPLGPLPLLRTGAGARLLIISPAPGTKAHASGLSFDDPSGDRLRAWLTMDRDTLYDEDRVAIMPMGFCYPGYRTMTDAVADWRSNSADSLPLSHPSWRTNAWEKKNSWFTRDLLPELRRRVGALGL